MKRQYAKVRVVIEYKVEVNEEFPLSLKDEKLQWRILADRDCDIKNPKVVSVEQIK